MKNSHKKTLIALKKGLALFIGAILLTIMVFYLLKPIPQAQSYHHFADQRSWLGIPNTWNVLSNIAIALPGIYGLFLLLSPQKVLFNDDRARWLWISVSIGLILTALGSAYYHLAPDNARLVLDRLPMTFVFMSLVAALISERVNIHLGLWLWPLLVGVGFCSVLFWYMSELLDKGDLRFYLFIQAFTFLMLIMMLFLPSPYDRKKDLAIVITCYAAALLFDFFDHQIYKILKGVVSGHTLKHVAVGLAGAFLIRMIYKRKKREIHEE